MPYYYHRANSHRKVIGRKEQEKRACTQWLKAIHQSTTVLHHQKRSSNDNNVEELIEALDQNVEYLNGLEEDLNTRQEYWHQPPLKFPPRFPGRNHYNENDDMPQVVSSETTEILVMRRLQVRILTSLSELLARKAFLCSHIRQWKMGVTLIENSVQYINMALELADFEYARICLDFDDGVDKTKTSLYEDVSNNASIVEISNIFLREERDRYHKRATQMANRLRNKLTPQWTTRDQIKEKLGHERWTNNPNPKRDYAELRIEDEAQLKEIEAALEQLQEILMPQVNADTRYHHLPPQPQPLSTRGGQQQQQRYNNVRPNDTSRRVSIEDYPDPTEYGWIFTGSWNNYVEFFEKETTNENNSNNNELVVVVVIKLDWYFTTGTIKTSLEHPSQGKTQMFGAKVTPDVYLQILQNPRSHTNVRYQTRNNNKNV